MKKLGLFLVAFIMMVGLVACSPADKKKITLAFLPNDQASGLLDELSTALLEEVKKALGDEYEVEYVLADDYDAVKTAIVTGSADIAWESGGTYVAANRENSAVVPLFTYAPNGVVDDAGYSGYIGTSIKNKGDFEGKTKEEKYLQLGGKSFSFVSATSTSGKIVPTASIYEFFGPDGNKQLASKEDVVKTDDQGGIFSEVLFGGDHPGSVNLVLEGKAYAGAFCCDYIEKSGHADSEMYIIDEVLVPNGPLWINSDNIDSDMQKLLVDHFTAITPENAVDGLYSHDDYVGVLEDDSYRFVVVDDSNYDFVRAMYE